MGLCQPYNSDTFYAKERKKMQANTISDMARYLKSLLPAEIPVKYSIKPMFTSIESEENIRNGILALKDFMNLFYDLLIEGSESYEKSRSTNDNRNPSIAVDFPFIYHTRSVLLNIGYHSALNGDALIFSGLKTLAPIICCEGMEATTKISVPKLMGCLRFLNECGMYFEGFDLDAAKPDTAGERLIEVTYPDNPNLLTGLKIMAVAQRDLPWKTNDEIFLRCDYRALTMDKTDAADALRDFVSPFSSETQEYFLQLHQKCLEKGLDCKVKIGLKNSFLYSHKKAAVWELSSSFADGYRIFVKMFDSKTAEFSPALQGLIDKGLGCEKDCHGFYIPLGDSVLNVCEELAYFVLRFSAQNT